MMIIICMRTTIDLGRQPEGGSRERLRLLTSGVSLQRAPRTGDRAIVGRVYKLCAMCSDMAAYVGGQPYNKCRCMRLSYGHIVRFYSFIADWKLAFG